MSGKLSRRGAAVDPFIVMDVMAAAAEKLGWGVIGGSFLLTLITVVIL